MQINTYLTILIVTWPLLASDQTHTPAVYNHVEANHSSTSDISLPGGNDMKVIAYSNHPAEIVVNISNISTKAAYQILGQISYMGCSNGSIPLNFIINPKDKRTFTLVKLSPGIYTVTTHILNLGTYVCENVKVEKENKNS